MPHAYLVREGDGNKDKREHGHEAGVEPEVLLQRPDLHPGDDARQELPQLHQRPQRLHVANAPRIVQRDHHTQVSRHSSNDYDELQGNVMAVCVVVVVVVWGVGPGGGRRAWTRLRVLGPHCVNANSSPVTATVVSAMAISTHCGSCQATDTCRHPQATHTRRHVSTMGGGSSRHASHSR